MLQGKAILPETYPSATVYFGDIGGWFYALDRATGAERWKLNARAKEFPGAHPINGFFASPILVDGKDIDQDPNNEVTLVKNLNVPYFPARAQSAAWESGGIYSLSGDVRMNYYPCIRSVWQLEAGEAAPRLLTAYPLSN